ncbi:hypothetical protein R3X27_25240 [Tropicimonas sp. TH_r6]|uniref:hypothetical protein n=1 Tax=Tropicimonas sp. TH_r6 TaxID=3082085 RepID=UPI00295389D2|nr:hypothetical protein [Tropicimonas sp. TH_r6]MDV7145988.1 hypothetical protein [Tropicimonas sp. TH_r6]
MKNITFTAIAAWFILSTFSSAQEVCYTDASNDVENWIATNGKMLNELSDRFEKSPDPSREMVNYKGLKLSLRAALMAEMDEYAQKIQGVTNQKLKEATDCAGKPELVATRATYDLARELLGLTTLLPEKATRIDFEEIRRGNIAGGKNSVVRKVGRDIDKALNPFRW